VPSADQHFRLLVESAIDYAIFSTDTERRVNAWNCGAERVFRYTEAEIIGQTADIVFTPEDRARGEPQKEAAMALQNGRAEDERWHLRKGGVRFYASGVMVPLYDDNSQWIGFAKIARDLTERKLNEDQLKAAREQLEDEVQRRTAELHTANAALRQEIERRRQIEMSRQEMLRRMSTAEEDERRRISRELHDEIGQHLAALMLGLNSLEPDLARTRGAAVLPKLQALTETIGREVHRLAVRLRPVALDDLGLLRAISAYVDSWSAQSGVKAEFHASDLEGVRLPPPVELALYRVVQEALTNVMKHAQASRVSVILNRPSGHVVAVIEDNGRGFEPEAATPAAQSGLGLLGMRERAAQLNGTVTIESQPGQGTTVFARFPV
jgi:PAS domain S-box-containing protein